MFRLWSAPGSDMAFGSVVGAFDADQICTTLRDAYRRGVARPGQDRVTVVDPAIDPESVTVAGLLQIRAVLVRLERRSTRVARHVFVCMRPEIRAGVEVYRSLWEATKPARFAVVACDDLAGAEAVLGVTGLAAQYDGMLPPVLAFPVR